MNARGYVPITSHTLLSLRGLFGTAGGDLPIERQFALGGIGSVHGYSFKQETGTRMGLLNAEYTLVFGNLGRDREAMTLFSFYDVGRVGGVSTSNRWLNGFGLELGPRASGSSSVPEQRHSRVTPDPGPLLTDILMTRRRALTVLLAACLGLGVAAPASALEARVTEMRIAGGSVFAAIELKDIFPVKFQSVLEAGGAIHLRLQVELWENRPVWDKLAQPTAINVFRMVFERDTGQVKVSDAPLWRGQRTPAWQEPLALRIDLGRAEALSDKARSYVRVLATLGTIAEKESATASSVVFGDDDSAVSLAAMGKMLFNAVLQANEYLQSVSADTRTRDLAGRELKAGVKLK